ncbi:MAG: hypothetical protein NTV80_02060 [Verrucomicrobia bacterium]|nr:hypothetical protein [Verrucomicrobiota bacterium]
MTFDCPAVFLSSLESLEDFESIGHIELPRETSKDLLPLGHEMSLWATAAHNLTLRVSKDRLPDHLNAFLKHWLPNEHIDQPAKAFHLLLSQSSKGWEISGSSLPWIKDPTWSALLQLPALRSTWINDLRANHFDHLIRLLPSSWLLDPTPLPPGSVISKLEIPNWTELVRFHKLGRSFIIHLVEGALILTDQQTRQNWITDLNRGIQSTKSVLVEHTTPHAWLLARYEIRNQRVSLTKAWLSEKNTIQSVVIE